MDESLRKIRHLINHVDEDPNSIDAVRKLMGEVSRGVILLDECLLYIEEVSMAMTRNNMPKQRSQTHPIERHHQNKQK